MGDSGNDIRRQLLDATTTAFVDASFNSSLALRPHFLSNDHEQGRKVLATIEHELSRCTSFSFSVAFITLSGIEPLLQTLRELEARGVPGRILTTDYLSFSEPRALRKLAGLTNIELRMYETGLSAQREGFHTKGYLFERPDGSRRAIVGSSNLTASALTRNREWNVEVPLMPDGELTRELFGEFDLLWHRATPLDDVIETYEEMFRRKRETMAAEPVIPFEQARLEPNSMQLRFMASLRHFLAEGARRALLISATGTGKTYASAFAVRDIAPQRVLFLAHREQILKQSLRSYRTVIGSGRTYGLLSGTSRETGKDYLFATMQTMSKPDVLARFAPDEFDLIVIDEVHRAGAESYKRIMEHFAPDLYLGMTASPDRPDGFDIYGLFDNNLVYEIRLQQALEEDLLCPFHYFGIHDLLVDGRLIDDDAELRTFARLTGDERVHNILEQAEYFGHSGERVKGLVFCSRKDEAAELARRFTQLGHPSLALSGANSQEEREVAIARLTANKGDACYAERLDYLFTVDIFNEGVDIPDVNQVILLRPTESPIVFIQQLGRGLRKTADKEFVVVLDFIGNYANNYMIPLALSGDRSYNKDTIRRYVMEGARVIPGASSVHFDEVSREAIFRSIDNSKITLRMLKEKYELLKHKLGRTPCMVDFLDHGEVDPLLFAEKKGSYYGFLAECDRDYTNPLSPSELEVLAFLSSFVANGMRPHELLVLRELLQDGRANEQTLGESLYEYCAMPLEPGGWESSVRVLGKSFLNASGDKKRYADVALINWGVNDDEVWITDDLRAKMGNPAFAAALLDVMEFGLRRWRDTFRGTGEVLKLYGKYTRKDVCRLLNWERDDSSTMYGYRVKYGTCPIFVTYDKQEDISKSTMYADRFIDPSHFSWMTRSRLTLSSPEAKAIAEARQSGLQIHLFVKKHDNEGSDFYYCGRALPLTWQQTTIEGNDGKPLPIVNFTLELQTPLRDDLYAYFQDTSTHEALGA